MRIIAGRFGSRRIEAPRGMETRPTLDMTRESLFNILQGRLNGARVLDLFAGSGALGLEALSRGAEFAVFCDASRDAVQTVKRNLAALKAEDEARVISGDYTGALETLKRDGERFDLIFIDPPYSLQPESVLLRVFTAGLLASDGLIVFERDARTTLPLPQGMELKRSRKYGRTILDFIGFPEGEE